MRRYLLRAIRFVDVAADFRLCPLSSPQFLPIAKQHLNADPTPTATVRPSSCRKAATYMTPAQNSQLIKSGLQIAGNRPRQIVSSLKYAPETIIVLLLA